MKLGSVLGGLATGLGTAAAVKHRRDQSKKPVDPEIELPSAGGKEAAGYQLESPPPNPEDVGLYADGGLVRGYADGGMTMDGSYDEHSTKSYYHCTGHRNQGK
jgi:hypothetical protein